VGARRGHRDLAAARLVRFGRGAALTGTARSGPRPAAGRPG
jgi:hypothetical protein